MHTKKNTYLKEPTVSKRVKYKRLRSKSISGITNKEIEWDRNQTTGH